MVDQIYHFKVNCNLLNCFYVVCTIVCSGLLNEISVHAFGFNNFGKLFSHHHASLLYLIWKFTFKVWKELCLIFEFCKNSQTVSDHIKIRINERFWSKLLNLSLTFKLTRLIVMLFVLEFLLLQIFFEFLCLHLEFSLSLFQLYLFWWLLRAFWLIVFVRPPSNFFNMVKHRWIFADMAHKHSLIWISHWKVNLF